MNAVLDKKGLTLVEVLVAMVLLLFVSLAMMQTALVSIDSNMINVLRDEAVSIAEMRMRVLENVPFTDALLIDTNGTASSVGSYVNDTPLTVQRNLRNIANFAFTVRRRVDDIGSLNSDNKRVDIEITWEWKEKTVANGNPYTHTVSTILRRQ
jgi:prepilin-type N-terminal cleavage/methylation domain-containing protein